jgi:hypothetical protein
MAIFPAGLPQLSDTAACDAKIPFPGFGVSDDHDLAFVAGMEEPM